MNPRVTLISAMLVALIGVAALIMNGKGMGGISDRAETSVAARRGDPHQIESGLRRDASRIGSARRSIHGPTIATLTEDYGEERVGWARRIVTHYLAYNKDSEYSVDSIFSSPGIDKIMTRKLMSEAFGVQLNADQEEEAIAMVYRYASRQLLDFKLSRLELERNPERLLALILASDARFREEIAAGDYAALQQRYARVFGNLLNPLDHRSSKRLWELNPTEDATLRIEVEAMLTADQRAVYQKRIEAYDNALDMRKPQGLAAMVAMDLRRRDLKVQGNPWDRKHPPCSNFIPLSGQ